MNATYRIHIQPQLSPSWFERFDGLVATPTDSGTCLEGPFPDQAALHGVLGLIRDLGLTLLSVERLSH